MISRRLLLASLIVSVALPAAEPAPAGLRNFAQVDEKLYRGGQPAAEGFRSLADMGVRTVIDLRGGSQDRERQLVEAAGMKYRRFSLPALTAPTDSSIQEILQEIDSSRREGPVFVHCMRGKDRTGVVIACYRMTHQNWENQRALDEAKRHGMSSLEWRMQRYILDFKPSVQNQRAAGR